MKGEIREARILRIWCPDENTGNDCFALAGRRRFRGDGAHFHPPAAVKRFVDFSLKCVSRQIGNGECWTLADEAFNQAAIKRPGSDMRVWGRMFDPEKEEPLPGDILEIEAADFESGFRLPEKHTAVIVKVAGRRGLGLRAERRRGQDREAERLQAPIATTSPSRTTGNRDSSLTDRDRAAMGLLGGLETNFEGRGFRLFQRKRRCSIADSQMIWEGVDYGNCEKLPIFKSIVSGPSFGGGGGRIRGVSGRRDSTEGGNRGAAFSGGASGV